MFIVTLDGVEYHIQGDRLTYWGIKSAKAQAVGQAVQKGQEITKATKITVEWTDEPFVTPEFVYDQWGIPGAQRPIKYQPRKPRLKITGEG
ncbi:hypothetical protein [Nostoc sp. 2RC]|uniref:hypothetical protein n=1 Tax=Nostoc sp. 2RC TaxID=2485484 RepID=UPI001629A25D|nr:hypothetical protein [Nostoc sp. 2RC]MBC1236291.1 hypothetical protein [Nostoc sp. 2RC]